jgi:hypothetical protein
LFCFVCFYGGAFLLVFFGPFRDAHITNIGNMCIKCFCVICGYFLVLGVFLRVSKC